MHVLMTWCRLEAAIRSIWAGVMNAASRVRPTRRPINGAQDGAMLSRLSDSASVQAMVPPAASQESSFLKLALEFVDCSTTRPSYNFWKTLGSDIKGSEQTTWMSPKKDPHGPQAAEASSQALSASAPHFQMHPAKLFSTLNFARTPFRGRESQDDRHELQEVGGTYFSRQGRLKRSRRHCAAPTTAKTKILPKGAA